MKKASDKIRVKRSPKRGFYNKKTIYGILDQNFIGQVAFVYDGYPVIIPTIYGRLKNYIYLHGAPVSRMLQTLEKGNPISVNITQVDGIVLARSAFHHSLNYQSVTIFGNAIVVDDEIERIKALEIISNQIIPERWNEVRLPNKKELKATEILKIEISEASAKIRKGPPVDDKADYELPIWAGVIPIEKKLGKPISDIKLAQKIAIPKSVLMLLKNNTNSNSK